MPDTLQSVFDLPEVSFIDNDTVDAMMNRMVSNFEKKYKEVTGKSRSLAPADPMRILIYSVALDLYQLEMYTDRAGKQDLLKYSYGEFLDNLGGNRGVIRQHDYPLHPFGAERLRHRHPSWNPRHQRRRRILRHLGIWRGRGRERERRYSGHLHRGGHHWQWLYARSDLHHRGPGGLCGERLQCDRERRRRKPRNR